jgi:predicted Zn-dependent protease
MKALAIFTLLLLTATAFVLVKPGYSYVPDYTATSGGAQIDHWDTASFPLTWNLNPTTGTNITGSRTVADVITQAFATWQAAPNTSVQIVRGADSSISSESSAPANVNLICFVCSDADFSKDSTTLAVTITTTANSPGVSNAKFAGQLLKADMIFNPSTQFNTDGTSGQNLLTVATHEAGHFLGLDHSAVVRAVMFPAASNIVQLSWDDVAGISSTYPKSSPDLPTGTITGTVRLGGSGVFGAHVFAESTTGNQGYGGNIRKSPVGALTRPDGTYVIQGLPPDSYLVGAEPLDAPVSSSDVGSYPKAFGQPSLNTSFTTRWH